MSTSNRSSIQSLNYLYRLCQAGERGFEVVSANVSNRGLKVLLQAFARQRAQFAQELKIEIQRLGGQALERDSLRGLIHRGRINIMATLTIGTPNVERLVLNEALLGERAAVRAFKRALAQDLPVTLRSLVDRQYTQIQETRAQVELLLGRSGKQLLVELFDSELAAETAVEALEHAGITAIAIETVDANQDTGARETRGNRVIETMLSGAIGGTIWGSIVGALAGIGVLMVPDVPLPVMDNPRATWAVITLGGMVLGALVAACLGFLIGVGVAAEDAYQYRDSLEHGVKLLRVLLDDGRIAQAVQMMHQLHAVEPDDMHHGSLQTVVKGVGS